MYRTEMPEPPRAAAGMNNQFRRARGDRQGPKLCGRVPVFRHPVP